MAKIILDLLGAVEAIKSELNDSFYLNEDEQREFMSLIDDIIPTRRKANPRPGDSYYCTETEETLYYVEDECYSCGKFCGDWLPYCCNGFECGCQGEPPDPPQCEECRAKNWIENLTRLEV